MDTQQVSPEIQAMEIAALRLDLRFAKEREAKAVSELEAFRQRVRDSVIAAKEANNSCFCKQCANDFLVSLDLGPLLCEFLFSGYERRTYTVMIEDCGLSSSVEVSVDVPWAKNYKTTDPETVKENDLMWYVNYHDVQEWVNWECDIDINDEYELGEEVKDDKDYTVDYFEITDWEAL